MKWNYEETANEIDQKSGELILAAVVLDWIESSLHCPYYEITYDHPEGTRRTHYESCDEALIHDLEKQKGVITSFPIRTTLRPNFIQHIFN